MLFSEYVSNPDKEYADELKILESIFEQGGFDVKSNLSKQGAEEFFVYVYNPFDNLSFEGVRVYIIDDFVAFRAQKRFETEPYGDAYQINLEEMFDKNTEDGKPEEEVAQDVVEDVNEEIKSFFLKSIEAEKEMMVMRKSPMDAIGSTTGTNYSSKVLDTRGKP